MPFDLSSVQISDLDKHRRLSLPSGITPELSLETGIDFGDGSLFRSPIAGTRGSYYVYSISQRFPDEWFGIELLLKPLVERLYNLRPKSKRSSSGRNGINVYTYSKGLFLFKTLVLGLPSGTRSRDLVVPNALTASAEYMRSFWAGYQYCDGSFYCQKLTCPVIRVTSSSSSLMSSLQDFANLIGVNYGVGVDRPGVTTSLRICSEKSIKKWIEHVPLLNPVHAARFLLWSSQGECPPGLHLAQYLDLAIGAQEKRHFARTPSTDRIEKSYLDETLRLVCVACIGAGEVTREELRVLANLWDTGHAITVSRDLRESGLVTETCNNKTSRMQLTERGRSRLAELQTFWRQLTDINPNIPSLSCGTQEHLS